MARWNILLDEIRGIGRGIAAQRFKGKKEKCVLNTGFDRKPVESTKNRRYVARSGRTTDEASSIILKFTDQIFGANQHKSERKRG